MKDPIVEEIHQIRQKILEECNYDTETLKEYFQEVEEEEIQKGRKIISLPNKAPKTRKKISSE